MTEQVQPNVWLEMVKGWVPGITEFGIHLVVAGLILFIGFRIAKIIRKMLDRSFERMDMELSLRKFLLSLAQALLYGIVIFMAAEKIGVKSSSVIALFGSAGLALGLSLQGSLSNFAGGVLILLMRPFKVGDYIISQYGEGNVSAIGLVYTVLHTSDNKRVVIPNGSLSNSPLTNVTGQNVRRVDVLVGIGYSADLKVAKEVIEKIYRTHPLVLQEEPIQTFVSELADSAVMIGGRGWTETDNYWTVLWDITESVKLEFDKRGIEIPFQQMDIHIVSNENNDEKKQRPAEERRVQIQKRTEKKET